MEDLCGCRVIHQDVVDAAQQDLCDDQVYDHLAQLFKAYSDKNRLKIIHALSQHEMCVCDLAAMLSVSESAVSHQLRFLRSIRLVKNRREGNILYYSLYDEHCYHLLTTGLTHLED